MKISIIVPILNEAARIGQTLESIAAQRLPDGLEVELLVVDGGSTDGTPEKVVEFFETNDSLPVRMFLSERGRAKQMNCGAHFASGDALLFLHADTTLGENALLELANALRDPQAQFGYFAMRFDSENPIAEFYASFTKLNSTLAHYGDSGIFARREFFERVGKFAEQDFLEDVEFLERASRYANPVLVDRAHVITSARRFEKNGYLWQMLVNVSVVGLYKLGASPDWLKRFYRGK
ncbi:MAG: TIGR04283 family arsenosugar biosynthesis glycosyltransferase [Chloroherpetonaceae bacterium]|nr:TIGR04283 family arsenosugar biosynthesis glycosyltransferase [Chloroherpetonaceae bacterium]MDW8438692.1 TIGR04283 family arsenosugar biosynthesis glycosyltransferase [Chloroherpetonaceae bacterium]